MSNAAFLTQEVLKDSFRPRNLRPLVKYSMHTAKTPYLSSMFSTVRDAGFELSTTVSEVWGATTEPSF